MNDFTIYFSPLLSYFEETLDNKIFFLKRKFEIIQKLQTKANTNKYNRQLSRGK
jgi:hypothetical protein